MTRTQGNSIVTAAEALQAEDARYAAQIANDFDALEALFADDLDYIHSSTVRDTKASFIESLRSGKVVYRTMTRGETKVRVFGPIAIITGDAVFEVTSRGDDLTLKVLFHSVWVRRDASLQFVSWQATRLQA